MGGKHRLRFSALPARSLLHRFAVISSLRLTREDFAACGRVRLDDDRAILAGRLARISSYLSASGRATEHVVLICWECAEPSPDEWCRSIFQIDRRQNPLFAATRRSPRDISPGDHGGEGTVIYGAQTPQPASHPSPALGERKYLAHEALWFEDSHFRAVLLALIPPQARSLMCTRVLRGLKCDRARRWLTRAAHREIILCRLASDELP